ncbi:MAG: patatin-like phospholipase family protein [bacterium]
MNNNWVLICQGGGGKGSWEAGFIYELCRNFGFSFKVLIGTSVGSINCALYLQCLADQSFERLKQLWLNIGSNEIFKLDLSKLISQWSLSNQGRLREIIEENINQADINKIINKQRKLLYIDACEYKKNNFYPYQFCFGPVSGSQTIKDDISLLTEALLASSAMPLFYPPIRHKGMLLYDGGLCATNPLSLANTNTGLEKAIVLSPIKKGDIYKVGILDFWDIQLVNRIINMQNYLSGLTKKPKVHFVVPGKQLTASVVEFNKNSCKINFALGQNDAKKFAENVKSTDQNILKYNLKALQYTITEALRRINIHLPD